MELDMGAKLSKLPGLNKAAQELGRQGLEKKELIESFEGELQAKLGELMQYVGLPEVLLKMNFHQRVMVEALGELAVQCDKVLVNTGARSQEYFKLIASINLTKQQLMQNLMQKAAAEANHYGIFLMWPPYVDLQLVWIHYYIQYQPLGNPLQV